MLLRSKSVGSSEPDILGEDKITTLVPVQKPVRKLLIAIPSFTGIINSMAVDGFMRLMGSIHNLNEKFEVFTSMPQRTNIVTARNSIVDQAIRENYDYILWLDDDMVIKPDVNLVERLLSYDKDIISPLFFSRCYPYIPMIFKRKMYQTRYCVYDNIIDYPKGLLKVDGIGFGCVLTKVEMFKKLKQPYFWANEVFGEDLYFCENATGARVEIFVDTTIDVGHIGEPIVSWESTHTQFKQANYDYLKNKKKLDDDKAKEFYNKELINVGKKVDIVMPCYHNFDITKDAIESIKLTEDVNYNIIPIIDGYDSELINYFKEKKIKAYIHKESLGFVKSTNAGIKKVRKDTDYVLLLNNDVIIQDPKWLINLVNTFEKDTGAVAPTSDFVMGVQSVQYNDQLPYIHYAKFLIGFCFLIRKDVLDEVGLLDEIFGIGGNDDLDMSIRIRKAGYKLKINRGVFIHHIGFQSLGKVFKDYKEIEDITRPLLVNKWTKEVVDDLFVMTDNFILKGE